MTISPYLFDFIDAQQNADELVETAWHSHVPNRQTELDNLSKLSNTENTLKELQQLDWAFTEERTGYLSHDIHPYPAKFIPQIPRELISKLSLRGELVWDPFGGCGTTALEAILLGRCAVSTDINPLAQIIGKAKTLTLTKEEDEILADFLDQLHLLIRKPDHLKAELKRAKTTCDAYIPDIPNISEWFHPNAIIELAYLRQRIELIENSKVMVLSKVAFSKSVLKASYQDGETRYARKPRVVEVGEVIQNFANNLSGSLKKVRQIGPLLQFREAEFETVDLRNVNIAETCDTQNGDIVKNSVDLVVTSPPYPNTTDYHLYHRFRLFWLGFDPRDLASKEIGSHLRHQKEKKGFEQYLQEMTACLANILQALRPGRYAVLVVGDGVFNGVIYNSADYLSKAAQELGFEVVGLIERKVHSTKRSFISAARRLKKETLLVLKKPSNKIALTLTPPPYKLWDYEEKLRAREIETLLGGITKKRKNGEWVSLVDALDIDKAKKLTFTHGFYSPEISQERTWQAVIENGDAFITRSQRKDPKYATHGIHAYKGKFYPQLAKSLFNLARLEPGQKVLDPFCGSGTVLLEAYLNGLSGFGTDINPLAVKIARTKTEILDVDPYLRERILSRFQDRVSTMDTSFHWIEEFAAPQREELLSWFPKPALIKLGCLLHHISQVSEPAVREILEILVSSVIREVSQQDPKDLRIRRRKTPLQDAPVYEIFSQRLVELRKRLQHFAERVKKSPYSFMPAKVIHGDCRDSQTLQDISLQTNSIDAIVTSPPYATALPYIDTDRLSILLLFGMNSRERTSLESTLIGSREITRGKKEEIENKIDSKDFSEVLSPSAKKIVEEVMKRNNNSDVGFRRQNMAALLYLYFRDMSKVMNNLTSFLKNGASAFFVIGNNKTTAGGKEINIASGKILQEIGLSLGWELTDVIPITVTTENRLHSKNSITENEIIWFKKK